MQNKKSILIASFLLIISAVVLTALLPEKKFHHMFYHMFMISVVAFALCLSIKDIVIILMLSSSVVWALGLFDVLLSVNQLLAETVVIVGVAAMMGWTEHKFKEEKEKQEHVIAYKKEQVAELKKELGAVNKENHNILEEIKKHRKYFAG